nr:NTP pyrophosphohydrolase [Bacteroidales bacterium]
YLWQCERESEYIHVFKCRYDNPSPVAKAEIDEVRFWTFDEIEQNIGKDVFTPNFEKEFVLIKDLL